MQHETALIQLQNAETQVEELKLQLDDALGAEEMVENLTARNLQLGEVRIRPFIFLIRLINVPLEN